jgi:hypothetical protein
MDRPDNLTDEKLMFQAPKDVEEHLTQAVKIIDIQFGKGYAKAHPELTGAFLQAAGQVQVASLLCKRLDRGLDHLEYLQRVNGQEGD